MVCFLLVCAFILLLLSFWLEKSWLTILTVFFFFAFFIMWLLVSAGGLTKPAQSMFDPSSYLSCYKKVTDLNTYRSCLNKIQNYGEQILEKIGGTQPSSKESLPEESSPPKGDCKIGGCSGQICSDRDDVITTCEYKEEYACYKTAECGRQKNGQCGWTKTEKLISCLNRATKK